MVDTSTSAPTEELHCSQELWKGCIPVKFTIFSSDLATLLPPSPYHSLLSRMNYLAAAIEDYLDFINDSLPEVNKEIWFSYDGKPLKAHLPVGVLYDSLTGGNENSSLSLPWEITIHCQSFPREQLLRCGTKKEAQRSYYHSLKQSLYLLTGSTRSFNELNLNKQNQLWEGLCTTNRGLFEQVARELRPLDIESRLLPVRVFLGNHRMNSNNNNNINIVPVSITSTPAIQKNLPVIAPNTFPPVYTTLRDVLSLFIPMTTTTASTQFTALASSSSSSSSSTSLLSSSEDPLTALPPLPPPSLNDHRTEITSIHPVISVATPPPPSAVSTDWIVIIQGIEVSFDAPLYQLWKVMAHADFFLYIHLFPPRSLVLKWDQPC